MNDHQAAYDELYAYTMGRPNFVLQHVVDAYKALTATADSKPIATVFSLVGLYLHVEKGFDGVQVQKVHQRLGARKRDWPRMALPAAGIDMTATDVMAAPEGSARDAAIDRWCEAIWKAFAPANRAAVIALLAELD